MSGYTSPSEIDTKNHGRKNLLSPGQEPPWAFLPLGYRVSAVASAMSGQFPPPSASPPIPYTAHHLPPAAPTPGQYPPVPPQRLRVPTLGSSPPPAQGHIPPWGHTPQNAGLNSLPGNLGYFVPPHIGGLGGPGRGQPQPWQASPKPTAHPVGGNPLFSLQMLVTQEASSAGGPVTSVRPTDDYQQETMDLSSHSASTVIDDHQPIRKDNLRNGGIVSNGEIENASEDRKSPAKPPDSVSVIAHNPLRESQEPIVGTVLNCSSKPTEKILESSSSTKILSEYLVADKPLVPAAGITHTSKPVALLSAEKLTSGTIVEKSPSSEICSESPNSPVIITSDLPIVPPGLTIEKVVMPSMASAVEKPPSLISKVTDDWEGSNHTPDNVESILENMFQTEDDRCSPGALPLVVPQSVIVSNDSRNSLQIDLAAKGSTSIEKPASPEKINEQKLAEILKVEEPDIEMASETKEEIKNEVERIGLKSEDCYDTVLTDEVMRNKDDREGVKNQAVQDIKDESKISVESALMESNSNDAKPVKLVPEQITLSSDSSSPKSNSQISNVSQLLESKPATSAKSHVKSESGDSTKNAFIEVESELEKMFAGIVEPGSEMSSDVVKESSSSAQSSLASNDRKRFAQDKKRGRPKGMVGRRSSDGIFSVDSSLKKKKRPVDSDKKTKKSKLDSGRDSPVVKKGRASYMKDASNDSGSTVGVRSRGPLVHIEGSKETPTSVVVVNSGVRTNEEDESAEKLTKPSFRKHSMYHSEGVYSVNDKSTICTLQRRASKIIGSGLYNSTLSSRYDSHTPDATWICVFCKRGPHCAGGLGGEPAGDLYGPYVISSDSTASPRGVPSDKDLVEEQKRRGGGKQASLRSTGGTEQFVQKLSRKHKRSVSVDSETGLSGMVRVSGEKNDYEVWIHEQCAVWAPGMYLIGSKLVGLQEAVWAAIKTLCSKCGEPGACISCITRGCPLLLHYGCAVLEGWQLDVNTYIAKCRIHMKGTGFFQS